jgi:hypothetical protein
MHGRWCFAFVLAISMAQVERAFAEDRSKHELANVNVKEALRIEAAGGENQARSAKLDVALSYERRNANALSQQGKISYDGKWLSWEELARQSADSRGLSAYEKKRAETPDTELGNWELATWCESRSLHAQKFAHLRRTLEQNPQNKAAKIALGWRDTAQGWVSPEQFQADVRFALEEKESLAKYGKKTSEILRKLTSGNETSIEQAKSDLSQMTDPLAITAIEKILSAHSAPIAVLALGTISSIHHPSSTRSLARHAIFHPAEQVRDLASTALLKRDPQGWAPGMVDLLRNQIDLKIMPEFGSNGSLLGLRHVFSQEGRDSNNVFVSDSAYQRNVSTVIAATNFVEEFVDRRPVTSGRNTRTGTLSSDALIYLTLENQMERAMQEQRINSAATAAAMSSKYSTEQKNKTAKMLNERVYASLDKLEGKKIGKEPKDYWTWWNGRKYWRTLPQKKNVYDYNRNYVSDVRPAYAIYERVDSHHIYNTNSCLTATTIIWTQSGHKPIKEVRIGDMALSKEVATGRLKLAPVVRTTQSEDPVEIISFSIEDETIECTKGHEFFVSGRGWTMACDLKVGDTLHGAEGPSKIVALGEPEKATVYNLVVAQTANYFVGKEKILSHDFSERAENYYLVPGLPPSEE